MKKIFSIILMAFMMLCFTACSPKGNQEDQKGFVPKLDTSTSCKIEIVGSYDNFEALEAEFDRFNEYYPNVELKYTKKDGYHSSIGTILSGNDAPNIFFSFSSWTGNPAYDSVFDKMENLADPELGLDLSCIRSSLIKRDSQGRVLSVPIFSTSYGMLINNDLFAKENLSVPTNLQELLDVCAAFREKGYESPMMGYSKKTSGCFMNTIAYPLFALALSEHPEAVALANQCNPEAGEYMRNALETLSQLISSGCINIDSCNEISDNYKQVLYRFFEGDVPMMICTGDTVSGTGKREKESEAFKANPFSYSFAPVPTTANGAYFLDSPSINFAVNKSCENLDMTNEFMRFIINSTELNNMVAIKHLIPVTDNYAIDKVYESLGNVPVNRIISPSSLGIEDTLAVQIRVASFKVATGALTVDEAVAQYGSFKE